MPPSPRASGAKTDVQNPPPRLTRARLIKPTSFFFTLVNGFRALPWEMVDIKLIKLHSLFFLFMCICISLYAFIFYAFASFGGLYASCFWYYLFRWATASQVCTSIFFKIFQFNFPSLTGPRDPWTDVNLLPSGRGQSRRLACFGEVGVSTTVVPKKPDLSRSFEQL